MAKINPITNSAFHATTLFAIACFLCLQAGPARAQTSKYDGMRDPFKRPDRDPNVGEPKKSPGHRAENRWEGGNSPNPTTPNPKPPPTTPPSPLALEIARWLNVYNFVTQAWRPVLVFTAGEVKAAAIENATIALQDIMRAYFVGAGWAARTTKWLAPRTISGLFTLYSILEPTELDPSSELDFNSRLGPDTEALRKYLKRLEEQRKNENTQPKVMLEDLPSNMRVPASQYRTGDSSFEQDRRRAIFSDQNLTKDGARETLAKAAGQIYGDAARRFTDTWLWLYDEERVKQYGLSQQAIEIFEEGQQLLKDFRRTSRARKPPNACLIGPPNWIGTPIYWACQLPYVDSPSNSCYCPTAPPPSPLVTGIPKRYPRGLTCVLPNSEVCAMVHSEPEGTLCGCTNRPGLTGLVK